MIAGSQQGLDGGVKRLERLIGTRADEQKGGLSQDQARALLERCRGDGEEPSPKGFGLRGADEALRERLKGLDDDGQLAGRDEVRDRLQRLPRGQKGHTRPAVQLRGSRSVQGAQMAAQARLEEVVIAVPLLGPLVLERDAEQMVLDQPLDHKGRPGAPGDGLGQRRGEPLEHRGVHEKALDVLRLAGEHLLSEKLEHVLPRERRWCLGPDARSEEKPGDPTLRAPVQLRGSGCIEAWTAAAQEAGRFLGGESERILAHGDHPARSGPTGAHGQGRPAGDRDMDVRRKVPDEQPERVSGGGAFHGVRVINDDQELVHDRLHDLVAEPRDEILGRTLEAQALSDSRKEPPDALDDMTREGLGRPDLLVTGEPHRGPLEPLQRLSEQGALAVSRARNDRHQAVLEAGAHLVHQVGAGQCSPRDPGRHQPAAKHAAPPGGMRRQGRLRRGDPVGRIDWPRDDLIRPHALTHPLEVEPADGSQRVLGPGAQESANRLRDEDLPTSRRIAEPARDGHRDPDEIPFLILDRLAGVHADADGQRHTPRQGVLPFKGAQHRDGGRQRGGSRWKGSEEPVAKGLDFPAAEGPHRLAQEVEAGSEHMLAGSVAKPAKHHRRADHVREEQGDHASVGARHPHGMAALSIGGDGLRLFARQCGDLPTGWSPLRPSPSSVDRRA